MSIYDITGNSTINKCLNIIWVRHLLYWFILLIFFSLFWSSAKNPFTTVLLNELLMLSPKLMAVYTVLWLLVPRLLFQHHFLKFALATLVVMLTGGLLLVLNEHLVTNYLLDIFTTTPPGISRYKVLGAILDINTVLVVPLLIKILEYGFQNKQKSELLEKEKLEAELKFLKTQIHPHFFFNTLNNLYALILKQSSHAGPVVLMLSELMRYVLYEANSPTVPLSKELRHIENYIQLEKLRLPAHADIQLQITGESNTYTIAPLLLIPIVENCYKHIGSTPDNRCWIHINIHIGDNWLEINTSNSIEPSERPASPEQQGVGLSNIKRRLELLYPQAYELSGYAEGFSYLCNMKVQLEKPSTTAIENTDPGFKA